MRRKREREEDKDARLFGIDNLCNIFVCNFFTYEMVFDLIIDLHLYSF